MHLDKPTYFFNYCEHPIEVYNKTLGRFIEVPCGKCNYCLARKSSSLETLCEIERMHSARTLFLTLTYNQKYVPRVRLFDTGQEVDIDTYSNLSYASKIDRNSLTWYRIYQLPRYSCNELEVEHICDSVLPKNYSDRFHGKLKYFRHGYFPVLKYSDVQKFIKRFRFHVFKTYGLVFRCYYVGEYGQRHFRPHYHLLFYFDKIHQKFNLQAAQVLVRQLWKFGDSRTYTANNSVSQYVSGYVNTVTDNPLLYKLRQFKARSFHSIRFAQSGILAHEKEIYEKGFEYLMSYPYQVSNGFLYRLPTKSLQSYLYPRCQNFANLSFNELLRIYSLADTCRELLAYYRDFLTYDLLAEECFNYICGNDPPPCTYSKRTLFDTFRLLSFDYKDLDVVKRQFLSFLYFLTKLINICDRTNQTIYVLLCRIVRFYYDRDMWLLSQWYSSQEKYSDSHGYVSSEFYIKSDLKMIAEISDGYTIDDYNISRDSSYITYISLVYSKINTFRKHRELSERNLPYLI